MAVNDSTLSSSLLGRTVVVTTSLFGTALEHRGSVIGVLQALPGSRASASILLDEGGDQCDFIDIEDITSIFVE